jgi:group II intron reverse transcriptase/maturase
LAHLITEDALRRAYSQLQAGASPGVDGQSKHSYGEGLGDRLSDLHTRLRTGQYRSQPARRATLRKPDGSDRLLSIWSVEDKVVQGAVTEILHSIFEADFLSLSYGFRPGRSAHHALQAVQTALQKGRVNWVLDLDLTKCFDSIDHETLRQALGRRVTDRSLLKLIGKWLTVGVVEADGRRSRQAVGVPQGAPISPVLANIVLHEAMDCWLQERRRRAQGEVYMVRYADDAVLMFEHEADAHALLSELSEQLSRYGLEMNQAKTTLLPFGRQPPGGRSGTFDFLGFTHIAGKDRQGRYLVQRKTARKRLARSLESIKDWCKAHLHDPIADQWRMLSKKLHGHNQYYGIRGNMRALQAFRAAVWWIWLRALRRRSQTSRLGRLVHLLQAQFPLPHPQITHPDDWLPVSPGNLLRRAGCGKAARPVL